MPKTVIAGALLWASLAATASAQPTVSLEQVARQLEALSKRVEKLEHDNATLASENAQLKDENRRLEANAPGAGGAAKPGEAAKTGESPDLSQRVAALEKNATASEWASRITWKGDFRYRHEQIQPEESSVEDKRDRIRARVGFTAKVNDKLATTLQIGTSGGSSDPRSMNQTLGDGLNRKGVGLDLAYGEWKPVSGLAIDFGKSPYAWQRVPTSMWDPDITWEGISARYEHGAFFASTTGTYLSLSTSVKDGTLLGAQAGLKGQFGGVKLLGALGYFDVGGLQGQITTASTTGCTNNSAFFGGPQGNSTFTDPAGCARLLDDFNIVEAIGQADAKLGHYPLSVFADYLQNQDADLDTAWALGFTVGKAADPRTWELTYYYEDVEKDSQFGQFVESDFGGGVTDTKGSVFRFAYAPAKNWIANATYFLNDRFVDAGPQSDYDRFQLDLTYKY